jgi:hypothetical protein
VYDFQILFFTWIQTNDQIEYAYYKCVESVPENDAKEVHAMKREFELSQCDDSFDSFKRVFYIMDLDKNGAISKSEAQKGISFLDIERILDAPSQKVVDTVFDQCIASSESKQVVTEQQIKNQLSLSDFFRLILRLKGIKHQHNTQSNDQK